MAQGERLCTWCGSCDIGVRKDGVSVVNAHIDVAYTLLLCQTCGKYTLAGSWGGRDYAYRAVVYPRVLRAPLYVAIYPIACAWCGSREQVEPEEINATIANPASRRHRYDIYGCYACHRYTAVCYGSDLATHPATPDEIYHTLYYITHHDTPDP